MPLFFMALIIDGVELNVRWAEDQRVDPESIGKRKTASKAKDASGAPDFSSMKKAELVEYLSPDGSTVDTHLTKAELVKLAEDLYASHG